MLLLLMVPADGCSSMLLLKLFEALGYFSSCFLKLQLDTATLAPGHYRKEMLLLLIAPVDGCFSSSSYTLLLLDIMAC